MNKLLIIIHGSKEHKDRYNDMIKILNKNEIKVFTGDLASHGSLFNGSNHNFNFKQMLDSALKIIDEALIKFPNHEVTIMGHSMGSFIVKYIVYNNIRKFNKVILSGTNNINLFMIKTSIFITSLFRKNKVNRLNEFFGYGWLSFSSKIRGYGSNWLSSSEENERSFYEDPLCGNHFTNSSLKTMFKFIKLSGSKKVLKRFEDKSIPQLILYGEKDPVTRFGKEIKSLIKTQKKHGISNHKVISYENCKHEISFDILKDKVIKDIIDFMN